MPNAPTSTPAAHAAHTPDSSFVPAVLNVSRFADVQPYFEALRERPIHSARELEQWIIDRGELAAACSESRANLYISMTCNTDDKAIAQAFTTFVEEIDPKLKLAGFELEKRLVQLAEQFPLPSERYAVLLRGAKAEVGLFREANVPRETKLDLLVQQFEALSGSLTVQFEGEERTLPQMARYQELADRGLRERAWRTVTERRLQESGKFSDLYDQMLALRQEVAREAGFATYTQYTFVAKHRFDYGPKECFAFHEGVEKHVVPLVRSFDDKRREQLGLPALRPWDMGVDPKGRGPLKPFTGGKELVSRSVEAMRALDPRLAQLLASMGDGSEHRGARDGANFDLDSRKGKAPGGYQYMRDRTRRPFIFMNAAGLHKDVETMVHEAGHAFHSMLSSNEPLVEYRTAPIEFCEVASMSMELLTMRHWTAPGSFYAPGSEDAKRAIREQLKRSVLLLPWIATIDAFQHHIYNNPGHSREQRTSWWLELDARFASRLDWSGLDTARANLWQRQLHLFSVPFYYIEYGIAQLGALQLWLQSVEKGETTAIDSYMRAMALGGSKPLPELFASAGLKFDFSPSTIERLVDRVRAELDRLPD
jgi:oligoendopeptidase F